jgi:SET domain-containing protein
MTREELLNELRTETYVALKPSKLHGIGVFAIQHIPKGCRNIFSKDNGKWIKIPISEVDLLPEHSKDLIETYCLYDEENYFVYDGGFKVMDLVNYLNHSNTPNIVSLEDGNIFQAIQDIASGEELLINYGDLAEGLEGYL